MAALMTSTACRVMLATMNGNEQRALTALLRQNGYEVEGARAEGVMKLARENPPDILLLDGDLNRATLETTLRILSRHPDCRATVILLLGPADGNKVGLQRLRFLNAYGVVPRPMNAAAVLKTLADAAAWSAELRGMFGIRQRATQQSGATRHVEGCNSLLMRDVACPFHDTPVPTVRFLLRSGKIRGDVNHFDVPVYEAGVAGSDFINFALVETTVCPQCGFASNDPGWFIDLKESDAENLTPARIIDAQADRLVRAAAEERVRLLRDVSRLFWTHQRQRDEAEIALRLSITSGMALHGSNPDRLAIVALQVANDHLRLASLFADDAARVATAQAEAQQWLLSAYDHLEGSPLAKAAYQLLALCLTGNTGKPGDYLRQLEHLHRKASGTDAVVAERYFNRARKLWSDRQYLAQAA